MHYYWYTNTDLRPGAQYRGVEIVAAEGGRLRVAIEKDHPVARLIGVLKSRGWGGEIHLAGEGSGWNVSQSPKAEMGENGELVIPNAFAGQSKFALTNIEAAWQDGQWHQGAKQRLEIR